MRATVLLCVAASVFMLLSASSARAVRVMTTPSTDFGDPPLEFDNIALTPDGATIVATALFDASAVGDLVYSLPVPANPAIDTAMVTQLSTQSFLVNIYDVSFAPVISPDGSTILHVHDGNSQSPPSNTIYTMPIGGELNANSFSGLFGSDPNLAATGTGNTHPKYSPDGTTVFFINTNSAFGGSIPSFAGNPPSFADDPDWDQIYSVPASGGTPMAVTLPGDGDIDGGLYAVTPNGSSIVYAPDNPIAARSSRGGMRSKLFSTATTGGSSVEIPIVAPAHDFSINRQLEVTPDGQTILFIADYEAIGKNELFSIPITGGTPTRVSDDLPFAGDVSSFAISPNGSSVAYAAGQNTSANNELFQTPITGGTGNSIRVSEPAPSNSGVFDVSTSITGGQIVYSNDGSEIFYLGDLDTDNVNDLYVVDTTEKAGLVPSPYYYVGAENGDFFDESNWNDMADGSGNTLPANSINPATAIRQSLIIDGDKVGSTGGEARFEAGGSLEMTPGSEISFLNVGDQIDFGPRSGLKLTDASIVVEDDIILEGTNHLSGGLIRSLADDIQFENDHNTSIDGTILRSGDHIIFNNSATSISGATLEMPDRLAMRFEVDITVNDTSIDVNGGAGDVDDVFNGDAGAGSTLTLQGASTLLANTIDDGIALVLEGTSVATLRGDATVPEPPALLADLVDPTGSITFMSTDAQVVMLNDAGTDARQFVINGFTGLSYFDDSDVWNVTDWDGMTALASLQLVVSGIDGDYNNDGFVDAADFTLWRENLDSSVTLPNDTTPGAVTIADYTVWKSNFGNPSGNLDAAPVPEPSTLLLAMAAGFMPILLGKGKGVPVSSSSC